MPSSTIDGQHRIDWIQHLLSTLAAVRGWKQFSTVGCSTVCMPVWSTMRAALVRGKAVTQMLKVICQPSFLFHPQRWGVEWWFKMSGFRVDRGRWARWDALWEKREASGQPTILWVRAIIKPQSWAKWNGNRTQSYCCSFFFLFSLICSVRYLLIWFFPVEFRLCTGADAMTLKLVVIRKCKDTQWPQEAETGEHRHS